MRIADRQGRLRQAFGLRAEHDRPGFRRTVGIGHLRTRQRLTQCSHQAGADRSGTHADKFDAGEISARHGVMLTQHHRDHRRHGGEPGAVIASDGFDIGLCGELRQQHDSCERGAGELGQRQRVHPLVGAEGDGRPRDQVAVTIEAPAASSAFQPPRSGSGARAPRLLASPSIRMCRETSPARPDGGRLP